MNVAAGPRLPPSLRRATLSFACRKNRPALRAPRRQSTVEFLGSLAVPQALLFQLSGFCIHISNLLEARMIITPLYLDWNCPISAIPC
jgi:hypothetical protein